MEGATHFIGLKHGALFAGVGGFELGAEMSGIETEWNCEISEFNRNELKRLFPNAKQYTDIKKMQQPQSVDIISAGFPCQDISIANCNATDANGGKSSLWREALRIFSEVKPIYGIIENSPALLTRGLSEILYEFAKIGYDAEWQNLCGYQFGIPQRRKRIYIILYSSCIGNRMEEGEIFSRWHKPLYPAWGYSEPKVYGMADVVPNRVDKHRALGNAVQPIIANYLFECIKINWATYGKYFNK